MIIMARCGQTIQVGDPFISKGSVSRVERLEDDGDFVRIICTDGSSGFALREDSDR